jgi:hypothetical protein
VIPKIVCDQRPVVYGYCRASIAEQRDQGSTLVRIKGAMAGRGFRTSHETVNNLVKPAQLPGAA